MPLYIHTPSPAHTSTTKQTPEKRTLLDLADHLLVAVFYKPPASLPKGQTHTPLLLPLPHTHTQARMKSGGEADSRISVPAVAVPVVPPLSLSSHNLLLLLLPLSSSSHSHHPTQEPQAGARHAPGRCLSAWPPWTNTPGNRSVVSQLTAHS